MNVNPTASIDLNFPGFIAQREAGSKAHFQGAVTDYCFSLDLKLRQRLASLGPLQLAAKASQSFIMKLQKHLMAMQGVAVTPRQYPKIYSIVQDCAERLGIGIPQVFIKFDPYPNAYTLACEESGDLLVIHSCLVEALTDDELKFVLGHECGHIHNQHAVYTSLGYILANAALMEMSRVVPGGQLVMNMIAKGVKLFLASWQRCAEATSDRAGLICCGNLDVGRYALAKLATGGGAKMQSINLDEYVKQLEMSQSSPVRLMESTLDHPIVTKRLELLRIFRNCEVLFNWRPEMRGDTKPLTKDACDLQCERIASVFVKQQN
jgi:Zn-dependent protease with chaperone function